MSTPNPFETAAAPSLIAVLQSIQTFNTNMGTDPTQWAVKFPGALQVLLGSVELEGPSLAAAEAGALMNAANTKIAGWISSLQGLSATATQAGSPTSSPAKAAT